MPVQTTYPGVYVQEVPSGVRTIVGVSTSIAMFIARASWGPTFEPVLCLNYSDFERTFTPNTSQSDLAHAVRLFFLNGGTQCYVMRIARESGANPAKAAVTLPASSGNSLVVTAKYSGTLGNTLRVTVQNSTSTTFDLKLFRIVTNNGVNIETDVQTFTGLSMDQNNARYAIKYVDYPWMTISLPSGTGPFNTPTNNTTTTPSFALVGGTDGPAVAMPNAGDYDKAYSIIDSQVDLFNLMILPRDNSTLAMSDLWAKASVFCQKRRAFLLIDPHPSWTTVQLATSSSNDVSWLRTGLVNDHSAVFYPRIEIRANGQETKLGPSGAIAGLMARTDTNRGVWKAPAGTEANILGISGLEYRFSDDENGVLNPQGINTLRVFPNGIVNWGSRTMDGDDDFASEWKYIPVRRTALYIEESLYRGLKWVVFEGNDERLWAQIRLNVGAFMHNLFRQGAFQGTNRDEAYFVKCDSETTTQNDINQGIVNVWVGFAPLKPAEFVILYLQQMTGQVQV